MNLKTIRIEIDAPAKGGLKRETLPLKDLLDFLGHVQAAFAAAGGVEKADVFLVGVQAGSVVPEVAVGETSGLAVRGTLESLRTREFQKLPREAHQALHEASRVLEVHNLRAVFDRNAFDGGPNVEVSILRPVPPPPDDADHGIIRGRTTFYGECTGVGGKTASDRVRVYLRPGKGSASRGSIKNAYASKALAKALAGRLYELVGVVGDATWDTQTHEIVKLEITDVLSYEYTPADKAFAALRETIGDIFDRPETTRLLDELRALD